MNIFSSYIINFANILQTIFAFFSLYGVYAFLRDWTTRKVVLSVGEFTIRRKYYDVQNITNIVSAKFYQGGKIPDNIRREIIEITCPNIDHLKIKK